jgi:peptide/nickel transport system substrate-binding protein
MTAKQNPLSRREFLRLSMLGATGLVLASCTPQVAPATPASSEGGEPSQGEAAQPTDTPAPAEEAAATTEAAAPAAGELKDVPRNRTFIAVRGGQQGKFVEWDQWNPFVPVANHQFAVGLLYEPLAFYSAFADKEHMWLAESYEFSDDFKELTIKVRPNIKWSDGVDFTAEDVTFTLNACKEYGAKIRWGTNVAQVMDKAETIDPLTTKITLTVPAPRFFWLLTYHFDIGVYMLPKHIFEGQDVSSYTHFDLEKGLPVTTSPWRVVHSSPQQKILDRADDWWGAAAGVAELPAVERFILLPDQGEQQLVQSVIKNEVDFTTGIQPTSFPTVLNGNAKATSWTGSEPPFGYVDWWPHSLYVNNEVAPWSDKDVRWALSYYIDRDKIVEVAWAGSSKVTPLPLPDYPPLKPYFDAAAPLLETYNTLEYNPEKGDALLTNKGWTKNDAGMWLDENGQQVKLDIVSFFDFTSVGPVVVEFLKRAGIESSYSEPPDFFDNFSTGNFTGCLFGHGGSCREPQETLALYQSSSQAIPGGHAVNFSRWHNDAFDALADEAYVTPPTDTEKLLDIWVRAMEIWLPELPDIQLTHGLHRLPWTTEYWTNMPDQNNPYTNSAQWHLTFPLVLHNVKPTQA